MEHECIFCLLLLTISSVYSFGLGGRGNVKELYEKVPMRGVEHDSKCHVQGTWEHTDEAFKMVCYQCNDDQRYVIISYYSIPRQHMVVLSCDHLQVAGSVTIWPANSNKVYKHKIEYDLNTVSCSYILYYSDHKSNILDCDTLGKRYDPPFRWNYYNGWKHMEQPWTTGVVRELLSPTYGIWICDPVGRWNYKYQQIQMVCYDCKDEYIVKIYSDGHSLTTASVGTCQSPNLEKSIDIILPDDKRSNVIGVQYKYFDNHCDHNEYTKEQGGEEVFNTDICVKGSTALCCPLVASFKSYKNGWLKVEV